MCLAMTATSITQNPNRDKTPNAAESEDGYSYLLLVQLHCSPTNQSNRYRLVDGAVLEISQPHNEHGNSAGGPDHGRDQLAGKETHFVDHSSSDSRWMEDENKRMCPFKV
jgi:hypothetical protein